MGAPLLGVPKEIETFHGMRSWVLEWLTSASSEERELVMMAWYELWLARNNARESKRIEEPGSIMDRVLRLGEEWRSVRAKETKLPVQREIQTWRKPAAGWTKANADGALAKDHGSGAGGVVLRDCHGKFIAGACHFFPAVADPKVVELRACHRAILLAQELNVQKLILETDSKEAVRKIVDIQKDFSPTGHLVEEIKTLLGSMKRLKVAHILAREGCCKSLCKTWLHVPPECISSEVTDEMNTE